MIFPALLSKLQVVAEDSDWFIALFVPLVIGRSDYFGIGFSALISLIFLSPELYILRFLIFITGERCTEV